MAPDPDPHEVPPGALERRLVASPLLVRLDRWAWHHPVLHALGNVVVLGAMTAVQYREFAWLVQVLVIAGLSAAFSAVEYVETRACSLLSEEPRFRVTSRDVWWVAHGGRVYALVFASLWPVILAGPLLVVLLRDVASLELVSTASLVVPFAVLWLVVTVVTYLVAGQAVYLRRTRARAWLRAPSA